MKFHQVTKNLAMCFFWVWSAVLAAATLPDTGFTPRLEVSGTVSVTAVQPDGKMLVAGDFSTINGVGRYQLARLNVDGSLDTSFVLKGFEVSPMPMYLSLAVQSDGKILVGGHQFWSSTVTAGSYFQNLTRLNSDGSLDETFDAGRYYVGNDPNAYLGLNNAVHSILVQSDGKILIGGEFTRVRGSVRSEGLARWYIARLNADGSADTTFDPGTGADAMVLAMALQADGKVLAAGDFSNFNGASHGRLVRLLASGAVDTGFVAPAANAAIKTVAVQPDGRIAIGGDFTMIGSSERLHAARLSVYGTLDSWAIPLYFWSVNAIVALPDNSILIGGWNPGIIFEGWPMEHDAHIQRYDSNGTVQGVQYFEGKPTEVLTMARRPDGNVVVGGSFSSFVRFTDVPLVYHHGLALFSENLLPVSGFNTVAGRSSAVTALVDRGSGKLLAGGSFNLVNGVAAAPLVGLNADGSIDTGFSLAALSGTVNAAVNLPDGSLVVAGDFYDTSGVNLDGVLHLSATGALITGDSFGLRARALAVAPDGKIYLGGSADASFRGVIRLNTDWSVDTTFAVSGGLSNSVAPNRGVDYVNAMAVQPDGKLLLVGQFDQFNGSARSNVVRLNTDGSVDAGFVPPLLNSFSTSKMPEVFAVRPQADGKALVGGYFQGYGSNGDSAPGLLRLNADGSVDASFALSAVANTGGEVKAIALDSAGKIILGGGFQVFEGSQFFNYFVRLNTDGSRDASLAPSFAGNQVTQLAVIGSRILAGGDFYQVSGQQAVGLAAFDAANGWPVFVGWNLLGNSTDQAIDPVAVFGNVANPTALSASTITVWTWDAAARQWAFFTPTKNAADLAAYAQSKSYQVLQSIAPRQGFWINSTSATAVPPSAGNPVSIGAANLVPAGWNLVSDARGLTPAAFNADLGSATANYTTLWAWDTQQAGWYFHAPSLQTQGTLTQYITDKSYLDFTSASRTLRAGSGFWLNMP